MSEKITKAEYEVGDTVELKSGGPCMTVNAFMKTIGDTWFPESDGSNYVNCIWFVDGKRFQENFAINTVKKINPKIVK